MSGVEVAGGEAQMLPTLVENDVQSRAHCLSTLRLMWVSVRFLRDIVGGLGEELVRHGPAAHTSADAAP